MDHVTTFVEFMIKVILSDYFGCTSIEPVDFKISFSRFDKLAKSKKITDF